MVTLTVTREYWLVSWSVPEQDITEVVVVVDGMRNGTPYYSYDSYPVPEGSTAIKALRTTRLPPGSYHITATIMALDANGQPVAVDSADTQILVR
jgi:hypothetical protein